MPFFFGPRQITASSGDASKNPIDITDKLSSTYCEKIIFMYFVEIKVLNLPPETIQNRIGELVRLERLELLVGKGRKCRYPKQRSTYKIEKRYVCVFAID